MPTELVILSNHEVTEQLMVAEAAEILPSATWVSYRGGDITQFLTAAGSGLLSVFRTRQVRDAGEASDAVVDPPAAFTCWTDVTIPFGDATRGRELAAAIASRVGGVLRERMTSAALAEDPQTRVSTRSARFTGSPDRLAKTLSLAEFRTVYRPEWATWRTSTGYTALLGALANPDPAARVAISHLLLDDGADAGVRVAGNVGALLVLLERNRRHDADARAEAALVARLLAGGADPNLHSRRYDPPLRLMMTLPLSDEQLVPYYDAFFAREDLRFDLQLAMTQQYLFTGLHRVARTMPLLHERFLGYLRDHPEAPVPTAEQLAAEREYVERTFGSRWVRDPEA